MQRVLLGCVLLAGLLLGVRATPAAACSCAFDPDPQTALRRSGAVFVGEVTRIEEPRSPNSGANRRLHVSVDRVFRGTVAARVVITTAASTASCGLEIPGLGRYVMFVPASEVTTTAPVNLCDGPSPLLTEAPDSFGPGVPPQASHSADPSPTVEPAWVPWLTGAAVAAALAAVIILYRRWLRRSPRR